MSKTDKSKSAQSPLRKHVLAQAVDLVLESAALQLVINKEKAELAEPVPIQSVRQRIATYVEEGLHSTEVIETLYNGSTFVPSEGYLFDYKRSWPEERSELCKYARHVAAFHNVFGGFIFFGVEEVEKDTVFNPCITIEPIIDIKQFNDLIREYLSTPVEVTIKTHHVKSEQDSDYYVTVMHIPKRRAGIEPNSAKKNLNDVKGKSLIKAGEIYIRDGDNSIPAQQQQHWKMVYGQRNNPYLIDSNISLSDKILGNNLPDRSLIYGQFVGRMGELEQLWSWFSDDFSRVRVLAGEGGLGKTSIAYEFASDVCRTMPVGFDCVIWLTAKKQQFRALENSFEELGLEVFETTGGLMRQMGTCMGLIEAEVNACPDSQLPRLIKQASSNVTALVVIDDLDSLDIDEQKQCIEICQQFSTTKSRFLFTTRKNATASSASSIEIKGFGLSDFKEFIEVWKTRLKLNNFSNTDIENVLAVTEGSPLFTESVLRLLKQGVPLPEALRLWKSHLGIEVRNAALEREVKQLGMEARKVLALVATLGSCSFAEIKTLSGFTEQTIIDASNELQSLFLLSTPPIATERRFAVSSTTRQLVRSLGAELLPGYDDFIKEIHRKKYKAAGEGRRTSLRTVATAINQAMAQITDGRPNDALNTVNEINDQLGGKNADLLSVKARALAMIENQSFSTVRKAFVSAYDAGQRKEIFFDCWYGAEVKALNWDGAIQVIDRALRGDEIEKPNFWIMKRIDARFEAASRHRNSDVEHVVNQVKAAVKDLQLVAKYSDLNTAVDYLRIQRSTERFADLHWDISRNLGHFSHWLDALERQLDFVRLGDKRFETYIRAAVAFVGLRSANAPRNVEIEKLRDLLNAFNSAPLAVKLKPQFNTAYAELRNIFVD